MKLNKILAFNAGYVDTASFLALHGLFAAHVTGNFVTLGSALISDNQSGAWIKLMALPAFAGTIILTQVVDSYLNSRRHNSYEFFLGVMFVLLLLAAPLSWFYLPFPPTDTIMGFILAILLVMAMAIQNALHKLYWTQEDPTTVMTGSTTQLSLSIGKLLYPISSTSRLEKNVASPLDNSQEQVKVMSQIKTIAPKIVAFAFGCMVAALVYHFMLKILFFIPPLLMVLVLIYRNNYKRIIY